MLKNQYFFYFLSLILLTFSCKKDQYVSTRDYSASVREAHFTSGSETCMECHQKEFSEWKNSHHDLAMQIANSTTILGDFNNAEFMSKGVNYKFFKKDDGYYVNTEGEEGIYSDYKIAYTFGVYPLQQYLIEFPGGRYQCLLAAWDAKDKKWFYLLPNLEVHSDEWLHWTGGSMTWNTMCADCHSTNLHKNYDQSTDSYNTTFSIINVSCEACHGPSSEHVTFYKNQDKADYKGKEPPKLYMGKTVPPKELVEKCARCHSRRSQLTKYFDYKGHYLDYYNPSLMVTPIYEPDGQIKDEDYVYGSFVQSKMYHNNVSCKDCHDVHSLKLKKQGNDLCLNCHEPKYNTYQHHYHKLETDGALCVNCHMTGKYYMGNDFRRDHSFRVPRPDQTVAYGVPNACNQCHIDKSPQWAANFIKKTYGDKRPEHYSDKLLAGYHGDVEAFYEVVSKKDNPEIIRATALGEYYNRINTQDQINKVLRFVNDSSALVRNETALGLGKMEGVDFSNNVQSLLTDSIRLVRISAARYSNLRNLNLDNNPLYKKAQDEFMEELDMNSDFASGQHQIALYEQAKGNMQAANKAYRKALEIDNYFNQSRLNLAFLEYNNGNVKEAEKLYLKVIEQEPDYSYSYFMLGLLYNEKGDEENAMKYLELATKKQPFMERAYYNYALKLQEKGAYEKSIKVLNRALEFNPMGEGLLYVKLLAEMNTNKIKDAYNTCSKLIQLAPDNPNYQNILAEIKRN